MICDKCGEDARTYTRTTDGRVLCSYCAKGVDPFVKLSRTLRKFRGANVSFADVIAVNRAGKRCYTNSRVLISESASFEMEPKTIDVQTGKPGGRQAYPNIKMVLDRIPTGNRAVELPEEFYQCLKPFDTNLARTTIVWITHSEVYVEEKKYGRTLTYEGADTSKVVDTVCIDAVYLSALQPSRILLGKTPSDVCLFEGCRAKGADVKYAVVAPMLGGSHE